VKPAWDATDSLDSGEDVASMSSRRGGNIIESAIAGDRMEYAE